MRTRKRHTNGVGTRTHYAGDLVDIQPLDVAKVHRRTLALGKSGNEARNNSNNIVTGRRIEIAAKRSRNLGVRPATTKTVEAKITSRSKNVSARIRVKSDDQTTVPKPLVEVLRDVLSLRAATGDAESKAKNPSVNREVSLVESGCGH